MANFWSKGKKDKGKLEEMEDNNLDISCVEERQVGRGGMRRAIGNGRR